MSGEMVFTVSGATATAAKPISLADAGLKEREHLQEWVIANPDVLGPDVKIVAFEYGRWSGSGGAIERDRLDVLGLDREGRLVVVELKRDKAPDTVDMQALKYAALVSRFTREDLDKVHARYLTRHRGEPVDEDTAAAELDEWADITEETLRLPRLVLMASDFPKTVTATVVFLHQQLGLDVRLLGFQAYQTAAQVLVTVSQQYPPPDVEEFVLSPEVAEAKQARTAKQSRVREVSTVARLLEADTLDLGERLEFRAPSADAQAAVEDWLGENPDRRYATWQDDASKPLQWQADQQAYSPTGLARHILEEAAGKTSQVQGPLYWLTKDGQNLVDLAQALPASSEVPIEVHLERLNDSLRPVYDALDEAIRGLGPDVTRQSRVRGIKYYAGRKLVDVIPHNDHISVYIRGTNTPGPEDSPVIVSQAKRYAHAQVQTLEEVATVTDLVKAQYASHG